MSLNKKIISEKALLMGVMYSVAFSFLLILAGSFIVFVTLGCWPMSRYQISDVQCITKIQPDFLVFLPIILGVILGIIVTALQIKRK